MRNWRCCCCGIAIALSVMACGKKADEPGVGVLGDDGTDKAEKDDSNKPDALVGQYTIRLPKGFEHEASIKQLDPGRYRLDSRSVFRGTYRLIDQELVMDDPDLASQVGVAWKLEKAGALILVNSGDKNTDQYLGTTLTRTSATVPKALTNKPKDDVTNDEVNKNSNSSANNNSSLAGSWALKLRSGDEKAVTIEHIADNKYRLILKGNFGGEYEYSDDQFKLVKPNNKRMTILVWKLEGPNSMVIVEAPPQRNIGSDYRGLRLERTPN